MKLICPSCRDNGELIYKESKYFCNKDKCFHHLNPFNTLNEVPCIFSNFNTKTIFEFNKSKVYIKRKKNILKEILKKIKKNKITKHNCKLFLDLLESNNQKKRLLIIGSGTKGDGTEDIWKSNKITKTGVDVYYSKSVDVICDAHYLPFQDYSFDGVWIQAVLEHVENPSLVVSEIIRVLSKEGVVYSEVPFLQHVHEGKYDFTRYTVVGHRNLFNRFEAIKCGPLGKPSDIMVWSVKYYMWGLFRNKFIGILMSKIISLLLFPFNLLFSHKFLYDSCSGSYFLGKKTSHISHPKDSLDYYHGPQ